MKRRWALVALAGAQFVMVLDQTVMNVSISQLVIDFDTTVTTIQAVITLYCLVMAMLMLTGGKIGDIIGRRRAFMIGLAIYACGSGLTAIAPSVAVLALGWSVLEGIGAALVLPAMVALVAGNFEGKDRKVAYAVIGGVAGAGIAIGPILGGWATTVLSWRIVFVGEVILVLGILAMTRYVGDALRAGPKPRLDVVGTRPVGRGSRSHRPGRPGVDDLGAHRAEGLAHRTVRARPDPIRHRRRRGPAVGLRRLAATPRGHRCRPARPPRPAADSAAAVGPHRPVHAEPRPHGRLLHRPAVPPAGARPRCPADGHQDAARIDRHVRRRRGRGASRGAVLRAGDHAGGPGPRGRWPVWACSPRYSPTLRTLRSRSAWPRSARAWASSHRSWDSWSSRRWMLRAGVRPAACSSRGSSWAPRWGSRSSAPSCWPA